MSQKPRAKPPVLNDVPMVPRPPSLSRSSPHIQHPDQNRNRFAVILILGAIAVGGFAWMEGQTPTPQDRRTASIDVQDPVNRQRLESMVNRHVQMTNRQMEIEKEKIKMEATFSIPKVGQFVVHKENNKAFNLNVDNAENNAARDLRDMRTLTMSANDVIQNELLHGGQSAQPVYDEEYRREYARQFIENARRNGYEVTLSPDLKVIGVRQISGEAYR